MKCKPWSGGKNRQGYGQRWYQGKNVLAHRAAYCENHGLSLEDIKGQLVRHSCDNPPCVEPSHLLLGSHKDNYNDMVERRRHPSQFADEVREEEKRMIQAWYWDNPKRYVGVYASRLGRNDQYIRRLLKDMLEDGLIAELPFRPRT